MVQRFVSQQYVDGKYGLMHLFGRSSTLRPKRHRLICMVKEYLNRNIHSKTQKIIEQIIENHSININCMVFSTNGIQAIPKCSYGVWARGEGYSKCVAPRLIQWICFKGLFQGLFQGSVVPHFIFIVYTLRYIKI